MLHPPGLLCAQMIVSGDPLPAGLVEPPESSIAGTAGVQDVAVRLSAIGAYLQPQTTYHYRAIAASGLRVVEGPELTFTTPVSGSAPPVELPPVEPPPVEQPPVVAPPPVDPPPRRSGHRHARRRHHASGRRRHPCRARHGRAGAHRRSKRHGR